MPEMSVSRDQLDPGERRVFVTHSPALSRFSTLPREYRAKMVESWDELAEAAENSWPSVTLLIDPYWGRKVSQGPSPRLREILWRRPSLPVIAAMVLEADRAPDAAFLFDWGISDILDLGLETSPKAVWQRLRGSRARPLKKRVEDLLSTYVSEYARNVIRASCEVACEAGGAPELAQAFGVEPRTVAAWCAREGLPSPRRLLAWMRVMLAAMLLEEPGRSVVNAARGAGYATDHALRRAMRELAGGDPATVERGDLFGLANDRFNSEMRELREAARERRRSVRAGRPSPLYD